MTTVISKTNENGYYSRKFAAIKEQLKEQYPNLQDEDIMFKVTVDEDGDYITVGIRGVDVDTDLYGKLNVLFENTEVDQHSDYSDEDKTRIALTKDLGTRPTFSEAVEIMAIIIKLNSKESEKTALQ